MAVTEQLNEILQGLRAAIPELSGALIASTDGLAIATSVAGGDSNRMAAMVATALGLGKRITDTFGGGGLKETSVGGEQGQIYIFSAGSKGVLAVIAASEANVGLIHIESRDAAARIAHLLG